MKRLYYSTNYDDTQNVCGYVIPKRENENYIFISKAQYERCLKHTTIGGVSTRFHTDKSVLIIGIDV